MSDFGPVASASTSSSALSVTHQNPVSARIISLLNIADHLVDRRTSGLRISYAKYLAYIEAQQSLAKLIGGGGWPASQKKPKVKISLRSSSLDLPSSKIICHTSLVFLIIQTFNVG